MAVYAILQGFKNLLLIILIAGQLTGASLFEPPVHYKEFEFNSISIEKEKQYMRSG